VKCLYVKTSDSDVSIATIEEWKWSSNENRLNFVSKARIVMAVIDFIGDKTLTC
jgi:hypothetical protein